MPTVKTDIVADNRQYLAALVEAQAATAEAAETIKSTFEGVAGVFERIQGAMVAFTAVLAGGAAFKEALTETVNLSSGAAALGKQLGITATEASVLKVAMDEALVPQDAMTTAASRVAQTLKKNENAFKELGVSTRDSNGNFKDSLTIVQEVNEKLLEFKEGTDRNVEGAKIYGKAWGDVAPTLKLTAEAMEEGRLKAVALGLVVGAEGVAQAREYKVAMAGVHTVFDALQNVIGKAVIPALTSLGEWFVSVGPQAVAGFRAAIYSVYAAFTYFKEGVEVATVWIAGQITVLGAQFMRFATTAERALALDWKGAKQAWADGTKDIENQTRAMSDAIQADMANAQKARDKFFDQQDSPQTPTTVKDGAASSGGDGKEKSRMAKFEEMLAEEKAGWTKRQNDEQGFREFSKQQELQFWQDRLAQVTRGGDDYTAIQRKIYDEIYAIRKQDFNAEIEQLKVQETAHKNNLAARLEDEMKIAAAIKSAYGEDSKEYAEAQKAIVETKRQAVQQEREADAIRLQAVRTRALTEIQIEEDSAKAQYEAERISLERLVELEREFEGRRLAIKQDAVRQEMQIEAGGPNSPQKQAQLDAQLETLEMQHQQNLAKIAKQEASEQDKLYKNLTNSLSRGFSSAFQGIINGTTTLGQAVKSVFQSLLQTIVQFFAEWAAKALVQHVLAMAQNKEELASNAGVAATGAGKSAAQIPYVGWILAIGAMAAVFAAAKGYSAAGGFDIPAGMNPQTQLHAQEMVLPAPLANKVRNMTDVGSSGRGGGGSGGTMNFHMNAFNARDVKRAFRTNGALEKELRYMHRKLTGKNRT